MHSYKSASAIMYGIVMPGYVWAANSLTDVHSYLTYRTAFIPGHRLLEIVLPAGDKFSITVNLREAVKLLINIGSNAAIDISLVEPVCCK
jgi:hypothetical protein